MCCLFRFFAVTMGVLPSSFCVLGLFFLIAYASASPDVFDSVLGNTASCQKSCEMTYTLHTYPRVSSLRDGEVTLMLASLSYLEVDESD